MKIEFHCHSSGPSICADVQNEKLVLDYANAGYDAIVLVNHINWSFNNYPGQTYSEKVDYYFSAFDKIRELAKEKGIKVFFGSEVVALTDDGVHQEFILLGFDKEFLYSHNLVNRYNQKQLFELAKEHGLFMYQTHPFRVGEKLGDPRYMHGAEAFNAHYHHDNNNEKAKAFCVENNLKMVSGNDYHHADQPRIGGGFVPDDIENEKQLANYLLNNQPVIIEDLEKCLKARAEYLSAHKEK